MNLAGRRHNRLTGALGLVLCPAISGLFLGSVAILCVFPTGGDRAPEVGALVACAAFLANAFAICLGTVAAGGRHPRPRDRRKIEMTTFEIPSFELPRFDTRSFERVDQRRS